MRVLKNIRAIGPKVVVDTIEIKEVSEGGIVLPRDHVDREINSAAEGTIRNMGATAFDYLLNTPDMPQVGDYVFFIKYSGIGRRIKEKECRVMNDQDIFGIGEFEDE